jgi:hypothetical protein
VEPQLRDGTGLREAERRCVRVRSGTECVSGGRAGAGRRSRSTGRGADVRCANARV